MSQLDLFLLVLFLITIGAIIFVIKMFNAHRQIIRILDAIFNYVNSSNLNEADLLVFHNQMKTFDQVYKNLFDWSYKNILPVEMYEKIKPFIK